MTKFEQQMKALQTKTEWARNQPTLKERRQQKSNTARMGRFLDRVASSVETFELYEFINKHERLVKIYGYFFPEAVEEIVVDVVEEPQQPNDITHVGNVVYVKFNTNNKEK